ncbi:hypothetical protein BDZ97DRAFT_2060308 [Flammula alnicola]|nr:hypothetical protein BDZ97DRAFT_2060308 [Flammula alnicola]
MDDNAPATFAELGMDSAMSTMIVNKLNRQFDMALPLNTCHTHINLVSLTNAILSDLGTDVTASKIRPSTRVAPPTREREEIVIVGQAVRLPGDIDTPEGFWKALIDKREDIMTPVPASRWDHASFYRSPDSKDPPAPCDITLEKAGFVDVYGFDHSFFGISSAEAFHVAPNIRLSLEIAFEALENANIPPSKVKGSGICVGREHYRYRFACVVNNMQDLIARIEDRLQSSSSSASGGNARRILIGFSGQGSQYQAMGRYLANQYSGFRSIITDAANKASALTGYPILPYLVEESAPGNLSIDHSEVAQVCIFIFQYAVSTWLESLGVHSHAVMGHSLEEIAAADGLEKLFFSTLRGAEIPKHESLDAKYWVDHAQSSVRFVQTAWAATKASSIDVIVDVGPQPTIWSNMQTPEFAAKSRLAFTGKRGKDQIVAMLAALSSLFEKGFSVYFEVLFNQMPYKFAMTDVPTYPFQRLYNYPSYITTRSSVLGAIPHQIESVQEKPANPQFIVEGRRVLPGAAMVDAHAASSKTVKDTKFHVPLVLETPETQVVKEPEMVPLQMMSKAQIYECFKNVYQTTFEFVRIPATTHHRRLVTTSPACLL